MEEVWPRQRRSFDIGNRDFQLLNLGSYDMYELNNVDNKFIPGPCGGYLLRFRPGSPSFMDIYKNDGYPHHASLSCRESYRNAFWCNNGYIGLLDFNGNVTIVSIASGECEEIARYPLKDSVERVAADYPFNGGIAFYTEPYNFYVFEYSAQAAYLLCDDGKLTKPACAVAYGDGKGFVAFTDQTLAMIQDNDVQLISRLDFSPYILQLSPHGTMLAARDDYCILVRSTTSNLQFSPIRVKEALGDMAFLDEMTLSFIVKLANKPVTFTFQQGQQQIVDFFQSNANISHLIQDYESVRVYRTSTLDDGQQVSELYLMTPVHDSIHTLLGNQYFDRINNLLQAKKYFDSENIDSYKILEELKGKDKEHDELSELVHVIIDAAPHILDVSAVEKLLEVAAFGKYLASDFKHEDFANCINETRLLFNLRRHEGFVTTETDFDTIDKSDFLSIMAQMQKYEVAEYVAQKYNLNKSVIAENWAVDVFSKHRPDPEYYSYPPIVIKKLSTFDQINWLRIANIANKNNLSENDIRKMISCINDPQVRMDFIMSHINIYRNDDDALRDVLKSRDGDAIVSFLCISREKNPTKFVQYIKSEPILQEHYSSFKSQEIKPSEKYYGYKKVLDIDTYSPYRKFQLELIHGSRGFGLNENDEVNTARKYLGGSNIWSQCCDNQIHLIHSMVALGWQPQKQPPNEPMWRPNPSRPPRFVMERAVLEKKEDIFKKLAKTYKLSDSMQCFIRVRALAKNGRWDDLKLLTKKSQPVDWEDIAEICVENGNKEIALDFLEKMSNSDKKVDALVQFQFYQRAAEVAKSIKNMQRYNEILNMQK